MEQDFLRKTVRNRSVENLDNFVTKKTRNNPFNFQKFGSFLGELVFVPNCKKRTKTTISYIVSLRIPEKLDLLRIVTAKLLQKSMLFH
jgi:hypothetical protein